MILEADIAVHLTYEDCKNLDRMLRELIKDNPMGKFLQLNEQGLMTFYHDITSLIRRANDYVD